MSSTITALTSGGGLAMAGDTSGQLELKTNNGTTALTIDASQNVGIGTASPSSFDATGRKLVVGTGSGDQGMTIYTGTGNSNIFFASGTTGSQAYNGYIQYNQSSNAMLFGVNAGVERMRITSGGGVGIGTNNPTGMLHVNGGGAGLTVTQTASGNYCITSNPANNANTYYHCAFNINGTGVGQITSSGSSTSYTTSSDYRLKENIAPMQNALNVIQQLKPVTYNWKSDGSSGQGFIAHELQEVVPDCVTGEKDAVETVDDVDAQGKVIGNKEVPKYQGIDTSFLVATLTAAIQELNAKVDAQALEIATLKGTV